MNTIAVLLAAAAVGLAISRALRIPAIPVFMVCGVGARMLGLLPDTEWVSQILELGLAFLLFFTGLELTPRRAGEQKKAVLKIGPAQFLVVGVLAVGLAKVLGYDWTAALYFGLAVSASSTLVVLRHLRHRQQMFEPFGRLVIGVLLFQDLVIIFALVLLVRFPEGAAGVATGLGGFAVLLVLCWVCVRYVAPAVVIRWKLDDEALSLCVFALLFIFMGLAIFLDLPLIAGAFLAGVALSSFPINGIVRGLIGSLGDCFTAIFFTALGGLLVLPNWESIFHAVAMILLVMAVTPPIVAWLARRQGMTARSSTEAGLFLCQTSEISIIIGLHGMVLGQISEQVFSVFVLVTVATMVQTPFIANGRVAEFLINIHPFRRGKREPLEVRDHVLILGFGTGGPQLLRPLRKASCDTVVVDEDSAIIETLQKSGVHAVLGDAAEERILDQARANQARVVLINVRRVGDAERILRHLGKSKAKKLVRIFEANHSGQIEALGGVPVVTSLETSANFMELFEMTDEGREADLAS